MAEVNIQIYKLGHFCFSDARYARRVRRYKMFIVRLTREITIMTIVTSRTRHITLLHFYR